MRCRSAAAWLFVAATIASCSSQTAGAPADVDPTASNDDLDSDEPALGRDGGARRDASRADAKGDVKEPSPPPPDASEPDPYPPPLACGQQVDCGGVCVSVLSDTDHCGGCSKVCPAPASGTVACFQGVCSPRCPAAHALDASGACVPVAAGSIVPALALGADHSCGVTNVGAVKCWGLNNEGQLGDGTLSLQYAPGTKTPVDVVGLSGGVRVVSGGTTFTCAVVPAGTVRCWGSNDRGELGIGKASMPQSAPLHDIALAATPTSLATGTSHACAVVDGGVVCWGRNGEEQLGDGTKTNRLAPIAVPGLGSGVSQVAVASTFSCALTTAGAVKCWGTNVQGGIGTAIGSSAPATVVGLSSGVKAIDAGFNHACALLTSGAMKCWGSNFYGQLGDGTKTDRTTPVDVGAIGTSTSAMAVGGKFTCALSTSGVTRCWGANNEGAVGDGTFVHRTSPTVVSNLTGALRIYAGGGHACAWTTTGVRCWGRNYYGQLGDGTTTNRSTPVAMTY